MKRRLFVVSWLLITLLLLSACASIKPIDKNALLRKELSRWENFSSDGVIEASHTGLTLRKMFVLNKTKQDARLDVIDGGAFGIDPTPLVSVYLGEYFALKSPMLPQLELMSQTIDTGNINLAMLGDPDSLVARYGEKIVSTGKLVLEKTELSFSPSMQLTTISDSDSGINIEISYTKKGDPDKVSITLDKSTYANLLVDNITYGKAEVTALPPNEPVPEMKELLKQLDNLVPGTGAEQP